MLPTLINLIPVIYELCSGAEPIPRYAGRSSLGGVMEKITETVL